MTEYFRDEKNQDVLLFIDNIFRFSQAGSEVSALLGRTPSAVGYQPTLAAEMGDLQERITSTKKGSITSFQAVYVPADDLTDPAPATTFAHLDATIVLERSIAELGIYPGGRSARLDLPGARAGNRRRRNTTRSRAACRRCSSATRICRTSSRFSAWTNFRPRTSSTVFRARKIQRFLSQPFTRGAKSSPAAKASRSRWPKPCAASRKFSKANTTTWPKQNFYMKGGIDEVKDRDLTWLQHAQTRNRHARGARSSPTTWTWSRCPASEGEMGILPQHVPLMTQMVPGEIIVAKTGRTHFLAVGEGFVRSHRRPRCHPDRHGDSKPSNIDEAKAEEARQRAEAPARRKNHRRGSRAHPSRARPRHDTAQGQAAAEEIMLFAILDLRFTSFSPFPVVA